MTHITGSVSQAMCHITSSRLCGHLLNFMVTKQQPFRRVADADTDVALLRTKVCDTTRLGAGGACHHNSADATLACTNGFERCCPQQCPCCVAATCVYFKFGPRVYR